MHLSTSLITACVLASDRVLASELLQPKQVTDSDAFTKAFSALVHTYLPSDIYARLTATATAMARPTETIQAPEALLVSALMVSPTPAWLTQVLAPDAAIYHSGLVQGINEIRSGAAATTTTSAAGDPAEIETGANATSSSSEGVAAAVQTFGAVVVLGMAGLVAVAV